MCAYYSRYTRLSFRRIKNDFHHRHCSLFCYRNQNKPFNSLYQKSRNFCITSCKKRKWNFIAKKRLKLYHSKYFPSQATTFSHLSGKARLPWRYKCSFFYAIHESNHFVMSSYEWNYWLARPCFRTEQVIIVRRNIWGIWRQE